MISTRKTQTQNQNKIASSLPVILPKINGYGVTTTTIITESKTDLVLLLLVTSYERRVSVVLTSYVTVLKIINSVS